MSHPASRRWQRCACASLAGAAIALGAAGTGAGLSPPAGTIRDDFEAARITGWAATKGPVTIATASAHSGAQSLLARPTSGPAYVEGRWPSRRGRVELVFSYRRAVDGRQQILELGRNRIRLVDDGAGGLSMMRGARVVDRVGVTRVGGWNRITLHIDASGDRVRLWTGGARRGWRSLAGVSPEESVRFGAPSLRRGPVYFDAINLPLRAVAPTVRGADPTAGPSSPGAAAAPVGPPAPPPPPAPRPPGEPPPPSNGNQTVVWHSVQDWTINGKITYPGTSAEGTLQSIRATQAIFDDTNPDTLPAWAYSNTEPWNPERNTDALVAQLASWKSYGINALTISMQGGSPDRPALHQPPFSYPDNAFTGPDQLPDVSGYSPDGSLRPAWQARAHRVIEAADDLGIVVILSSLYFGQDDQISGYPNVQRAVRDTANWIEARGYTNVLYEIANEAYGAKAHELVPIAQAAHPKLLVGTAMSPVHRFNLHASYWQLADFTMLHGNGRELSDPTPGDLDDDSIVGDIAKARNLNPNVPLHINEDSAFRLTTHSQAQERVNILNALGVGNGYYDQPGFQSPPTNWAAASTSQKLTFFNRVKAATKP